MPDENIEVLDDFILDMDIETITLDDMEMKEPNEPEEIIEESEISDKAPVDKEVAKEFPFTKNIGMENQGTPINLQGNITINVSESEISQKREMGEFLEVAEPEISSGSLDMIEETPEPELPKEEGFLQEEPVQSAGSITEEQPEELSAGNYQTEDDIITIDGSDLDKMIYGSEEETPAPEEKVVLEEMPFAEEAAVSESTATVEEIPAKAQEFAFEEPVSLETPVAAETSMETQILEKAPVLEEAQFSHEVPVTEEMSFSKEAPVSEELYSEELPPFEEQSKSEDVSAKEAAEKIEEVSVVEEKEVREEVVPLAEETEEKEEYVSVRKGAYPEYVSDTGEYDTGVETYEIPESGNPEEAKLIKEPMPLRKKIFNKGTENKVEKEAAAEEIIPLPEETIFTEEPVSSFEMPPVNAEYNADEEEAGIYEPVNDVSTYETEELKLEETPLEIAPEEEELIKKETEEVNLSEMEEAQPVIEEAQPSMAEKVGIEEVEDFSFDLSVIPDVAEIEEDEPIALSLDELNNIDISEGNVVDYSPPVETAKVAETSEIKGSEKVETIGTLNEPLEEVKSEMALGKEELSLDELNDVQKDISEKEDVEGKSTIEGVSPLESKEMRKQIIEEKIDDLSFETKDELRSVLSYLDNLLESLPEDKIKQFAKSDYYDLYIKILDKLGI